MPGQPNIIRFLEYIAFILDSAYNEFILNQKYFPMQSVIRTSGQLGPVIRQLRKAKGWSQMELGRQVGLSQERISAIETHPERVTFDQLLTILMVLDAEIAISARGTPSTKHPTKGTW